MTEARPDILLACMLEPVNVGDKFDTLPLHTTVLPWFSMDEKHLPVLNNRLINLTHDINQFEITGGERDMFGPENDVPVTKLSKSGELVKLHKGTLEAAQLYGGIILSSYVGENYAPHVSDAAGRTLSYGGRVLLKSMQLITRDGDSKRVVEKSYYFRDSTKR